jgi:hypothetical protein
VDMRPVVTPGGQRTPAPRAASPARAGVAGRAGKSGSARGRSGNGRSSGMTVRRMAREADDGYQSGLVPGLRSGAGAERLAGELVFAKGRLEQLAADPPGLYAEVADPAHDLEERSWLAFQIAYLGPLDGDRPFDAIDAVRTTWASGELPDLDGVELGPRTSHDPARGTRTLEAYRAWAARAGSQAVAFSGETAWTPERRFARVFERLGLPGFDRGPRFDLLTTLGHLGVYAVQPGALAFGGSDTVTLAAKRLLGIGDTMLLERRGADLAGACGLPLDTLDVGFFNWERGTRSGLGVDPDLPVDEAALQAALSALGVA